MTIAGAGEAKPIFNTHTPCVLAINGGSSSIKFALYSVDSDMSRLFSGKIDRIASSEAALTFQQTGKEAQTESIDAPDHGAAASALMDRLEQRLHAHFLAGAGPPRVHGGPKPPAPQRGTRQLIRDR